MHTLVNKRRYEAKLFGFHLFKEKAGIISPYPVWVLIVDDAWMYSSKRLIKVVVDCIFNYKSDRFLVG